MCNLVEEYGRECAEENAKANAYNLFKNGVSYELVRVSIEILSDEELRIFMEKDIVKRYLQKLLL